MDLFDQLILFVASFVANWFSALSGGGAGLIQFPMLIFLGLPFGVALATHKVASVALGLGATIRHFRESHLERRFSLIILGAGLPGVVLGANVILRVPSHIAQLALGILTMGLGLYSVFKPRLGMEHTPRNLDGAKLLAGMLGLFVVGFLNGSITSGTGLFLTMWLIHHFGLDYKRAVAYTLVLCGLIWNGTGAVVLGMIGTIAWDWMPALLLGSLTGGYLGSHFALKKGNQWIKRAFEIVTILIGLKLILS
ncbi:MAG: sulfite exporter TauE/SafE family protein [Sulfurimicrobium sp.]|nr:sulfite exporter TauE/SafE family protein [Sulfurimicrobium sp.]MDP1703666.1 sulfite exporter TauE/SafE family protein [Sulfurimicrobium sp.]MDP2197716.1 sulfite exporter TauE/SafE family protein [Sulfurimicrobium sp.]MDP3687127.1 sulfite exporter TauE/SafE family protein [Sulfurimicrobium sp.]